MFLLAEAWLDSFIPQAVVIGTPMQPHRATATDKRLELAVISVDVPRL